MLHQDAFAADYQEHEYMLLGMAIKYAGLRGKEVRVIGKNRQTLEADNNPVTSVVGTGTRKMRKEFKVKLNGDESRSATQHARKIVRMRTPSDEMQQEYTPLP